MQTRDLDNGGPMSEEGLPSAAMPNDVASPETPNDSEL